MELALNVDCNKIIQKFVQNGSLSFTAFCLQWKTMKFHHIYSTQSSTTEILQTTTAMMYIVKQIFCGDDGSDDRKPQRIGALYMLYTIYFKQPTKQYIKIDVTLSNWRKMRNFIDNLDNNNDTYDEARFIFWSLHEANAFRFCAHDFHLGLEGLVDYESLLQKCREHSMNSQEQNPCDTLEELIELSAVGGMLPVLTTLEAGYNEMKDLLIKEQSKGGCKIDSQTLPASTIFKDIQAVFVNIKDIMNMRTPKKREETRELNHCRRDLKSKGYKVTQSNQDDKAESSKNVQHTTPSRRPHRMSAKTVFAESLPVETLQDLEGDNTIEDLSDDDDFNNDATD